MANTQRSKNVRRNQETTGERVSDAYEEYSGRVKEGYEHVTHSLSEHPTTSVLSAFAVGLGVGIVVGCALGGPTQRTRWYDQHQAEKLGRRVMDSIMGMVPDSVSSRFSA